MLRIYHAPITRSLRVIWLCEELALPLDITPVDFSAAYRATPEWRAISPIGKVPVLTDGALRMYESGAMVQYILDRYGDGRLQPQAGTEEHALFLQWCWFAESTLARPLGEIVNHGREFPGERRIDAVVEEMKDRAALCLEPIIETTRNQPYLLGADFSAADVMTGYSLMLAHRLMPERIPDALAPYWQRLSERPAYQRAFAS
ncbi:MAG: glutathione S-transferase family protein [Pseudomonadales bacterium]